VLNKGVAKKTIDPKEQIGLFLLVFKPESGVYNSKYDFAPYFYTERRIYAYNSY
jgi:hypothetical protein